MKVILFDADGVLTLPEELFTNLYCKSHGLDEKPFKDFFKNEWKPIVTGKKDLKESIKEHTDLWQWSGSVDELLKLWFEAEDVRNEELLKLIDGLRESGTLCYVATEQEKYRGAYMKDVMFKDRFDGYFITAEMGVSKTEPAFFEQILSELMNKFPSLQASDVVFFDDSQSKVDTAHECGIDARLYTSIDQVKELIDRK